MCAPYDDFSVGIESTQLLERSGGLSFLLRTATPLRAVEKPGGMIQIRQFAVPLSQRDKP